MSLALIGPCEQERSGAWGRSVHTAGFGLNLGSATGPLSAFLTVLTFLGLLPFPRMTENSYRLGLRVRLK